MATIDRSHRRIYCGPCRATIVFPTAPGPNGEDLAVRHANGHGATLAYTSADGSFIEFPEPQHEATPAITRDEIIDYVDLSDGAWSLALRQALSVQEPITSA